VTLIGSFLFILILEMAALRKGISF
jgi:hypothetical protein